MRKVFRERFEKVHEIDNNEEVIVDIWEFDGKSKSKNFKEEVNGKGEEVVG